MKNLNAEYIEKVLKEGENPTHEQIEKILEKTYRREKLSHLEVARLLNASENEQIEKIYEIAGKIKEEIYGKRIVTFAPIYVSDYCVNNCKYCGYKRDNKFPRKKLTIEQVKQEALILEKAGHKRLAFESGEDPVNLPIEYFLDCLNAIYESSDIRRINVNVAATTVENYKKLLEVGIGTYILFQETYHKPTFEFMHPKSLKGDYDYHLTAFDRAQEAGIDDVGAGILLGLYDYKYEVLALLIHNEHLEENFGVGFHTVSVPRLKKAEGMDLNEFPHLVTDEEFKHVVSIIRLVIPFTGIILSTRETQEMRERLLNQGVSQISAGSITEVGGYVEDEEAKKAGIQKEVPQFELSDERSVLQVINDLVDDGYIPSFCTACYRSGRTGDRFMQLAKSGQIHNVCEPNALMTLMEYLDDCADEELKVKGKKFILSSIDKLKNDKIRELTRENINRIENGERDLFL
ncbi:[FeFe] hydrogenase H-cluster radical SAM maturase HydG [Mycoplasmatota bacterium]|nr:[FeFe] hydrogenase H-cluster radical SAM maturase HydG [Mycoplasmatota bacterium]